MMPHLAESCWQALGHDTLVAETPWPKHDPALLKTDTVTIAVQVNGKRRGEVVVAARRRQQDGGSSGAGAEDGVMRALGRASAQESHCGARPYREHSRMKQRARHRLRFCLAARRAAAFIRMYGGSAKLAPQIWPRSMSSRWPSATAMSCAIS